MQQIKLKDVPEKMREKEREYARLLLLATQEEALKSQAVFIPNMIASTKPYKPQDIGTYTASHEVWRDNTGATIGSTAPYAPIIEYGRRPKKRMPPRQAIEEWVKRKFSKRMAQEWKERRVKRRGGKRIRKADWMAAKTKRLVTAILFKIYLKGIAPRHIYTRAYPLQKKSMQQAIRRIRRTT